MTRMTHLSGALRSILVLFALVLVVAPCAAQTTFPIKFQKLSDTDDSVDDFRSGIPALRGCPAPCDRLHVVFRIINCQNALQDGSCVTPNSRAITGGQMIDALPVTLPVDCSLGVTMGGAGTSDPPVCDTATNTVSVSNISVPAGQTMLISFWTGITCDEGLVQNLATFDYDQNPNANPINSVDPIGLLQSTLTFRVGNPTGGNSPRKDAPNLPIGGNPERRNGQWGISTPWFIEGSNPNCSPISFEVAWDDTNPDSCMDVDCSTLRFYRNGAPSPLPAGSLCPDPARPAVFSFGSFTLQPDETFRIEYDATFTRDTSVGECCNVMFFRTGTSPDITSVDPGLDRPLSPEYTCVFLALDTGSAFDAIKDAEDAAGNRLTQVRAGDEVYWHFMLVNDSADPVDATLVDDFPAEVILDAATAIVDPFPSGTCTITGQRLDCTGMTIPGSGGRIEMRMRSTLDCTGLSGGDEVCNEATVTVGRNSGTTHCSTCLPDAPANRTCVELIAPSFDNAPKTVADASGDGLVQLGETLTYTIRVVNDGNDAATGVVVTDAIPPDTTFVPGSLRLDGVVLTEAVDGDPGEVVGNLVTVRVGNVPVLDFSVGTVTFDVVVNARNAAEVCNAAAELTWVEGGLCGNPPLSVDPACMAFEPGATPPDLSSVKTVAPVGTVDPGAVLHYVVTTCNALTGGVASNVKVTDDVPGGSTYVPGTLELDGTPRTDAGDGDGADLASPTQIVFSLGDLDPGECAISEFDVTVDADATFDVSNTATVTGSGLTPVRSNTVSNPVNSTVIPPQIAVTKSVAVGGDGVPRRGTVLTYTLRACNDAAAGPAANLRISDPIPADAATRCNATYVPGSLTVDGIGMTDAGDADAGRFESVPAPGTVSVDLAALAPGACATVTFQVAIAATCDNDHTVDNTAAAGADGVAVVSSNTVRSVVVVDVVPPEPILMRQVGFPLEDRCVTMPTPCGCEVGPRLDPVTDECETSGVCSRTTATTWLVPNDLNVHVPLVFYEIHRAGCQAAGDPTRLAVSKSGSDILLSLVP